MIFLKILRLNLVRVKENTKTMELLIQLSIFLLTKEKNLLLSCYKFECRSCGSNRLQRFISLG